MENEENITKPKRKKSVSAKKEDSAAKETSSLELKNNSAAENSDIDLVSETKPAQKVKTAEKKTTSTRKKAAKSVDETEKIIDAFIAKPRARKTAAKKKTEIELENPVEKTPVKSAVKKSPKTKPLSAGETSLAETVEETKAFPQSEASAAPENISVKNSTPIETENSEAVETLETFEERSPVFKELAQPKLPDLQPENRAWLQMQSPTRIFFYWSLKTNPFETLQKVFGGRNGNYTLSVKLQNLTDETEKIYPLAPYGSAWFDVESDSKYQAEVGFFAADRPFIRLVFSNVLETPRLAPSPRFDWSPQFAVTTQRFAEVLDVSGYKQDAFEMALSGDDLAASNEATFGAFEQLTGESEFEVKASELRLALFALASGLSLSDLRDQISPQLFAYLEKTMAENAERLSTKKIMSALEENFGLGSLESDGETEEITYSVFGASSINFQKLPKQFWKRFVPNSSLRISS
jgi:hypothetical protein